jgi:hypothetical protein
MTRTPSSVVRGTFRAATLVSMMLLLSGVGLAQKVVTARATIPFKFWADGHEFRAGPEHAAKRMCVEEKSASRK